MSARNLPLLWTGAPSLKGQGEKKNMQSKTKVDT